MSHVPTSRLARSLGASLVLLAVVACSSGGDGAAPPPPTGVQITGGPTFDEIYVTWTPPAADIDGYLAEGRVEGHDWEELGQVPADAIGGTLELDPSTPELVELSVRLRSVKGAKRSEYSNAPTFLRGLRAPADLAAAAWLYEKMRLTWTNRSTAASGIRIERARYDDPTYTFGPFAEIATVAPGASSYVDEVGVEPGIAYAYRIRAVGDHHGEPVESLSVERVTADRTRLAPPVDVRAALVDGAPRVTWTNQSAIATSVRVLRGDGFLGRDGSYEVVATLPPDATAWSDPAAGPGVYTYTVVAGTTWAWDAAEWAQLVVPAPGFASSVVLLPAGAFTARDGEGRWWKVALATDLYGGPGWVVVHQPDAGGGWTEQRFPAALGSLVAEPGVLLDGAGRPHVVYASAIPNGTTAYPSDIVHAWHDGAAWQTETIARRTLASSSARSGIAFWLRPDGTPLVAWMSWSPYGLLEAAQRSGAAWAIETLAAEGATLLDARVRGDGTQLVAARQLNALVLFSRGEGGGAFSSEVVPTEGSIDDRASLMPRPDGVTVAYQRYEFGAELPNRVTVITRAAGAWGAPEDLGGYSAAVTGLPWAAASLGPRVAFVAPEANPDGLWLRDWSGSGAWTVSRLRQTTYVDPSWMGFDAAGKLLVLSPVGPAPGGLFAHVLYVEE